MSHLSRPLHAAAAALLLAAAAAQAQFAAVPAPLQLDEQRVSAATTERDYRLDAARHLYAVYAPRIYPGVLPPLLHGIVVTETRVDAHGGVAGVRIVREPSSAKEVVPWVVSMIRGASPLPPPTRIGAVRYVETWLVDKSGQFQLHTLSEGQR
jgi:hypothetical protein